MANILGKVLSGIGQGYLRNRQERRANLEEQQGYQKQMERKRESLDLADEYDMRQEERRRQNQLADEQRQRTNRISDEETAYQRELLRADEMSNKKIQEIAALYPDRWKDPKFQQETTGLVKGIKVPPLPANKQIAELAMAGKIKEAMQLALKSDNPEDQQFLQTSIASIRQAEALKKLLNPEPTNEQRYGIRLDNDFVQGALDQGNSAASGIISKFIPGMDQSVMATPTKTTPSQSIIATEKTIKPIRQVRDDAAKVISAIQGKYKNEMGDFDPALLVGTPDQFRYQEAEDRYNKAAAVVNKYNDTILSGGQTATAAPTPSASGKSPALERFMNLSQKFLDVGKAPSRNVVKKSEAK